MSDLFATSPDSVSALPAPGYGDVLDVPAQLVSFAPVAERRPPWAAAEVDAEQAGRPTPERWFEPTGTEAVGDGGPPPATSAPGGGRRAGGGILGLIVAASLVSAMLASAGTYGLLRATGSLDRPAATPAAVAAQTAAAPQPVVIDEQSAMTTAAARVSPAVVTITESGSAVNPNDPFGQVPTSGIGSGVIFDASGWIVTNKHVVAGSTQLEVALEDGRQFSGTIYGIDTLTDLAIVKVDATGLPTAPMGDSSAAKVGQLFWRQDAGA
jgi:hypothetical protein